jgi:transposase
LKNVVKIQQYQYLQKYFCIVITNYENITKEELITSHQSLQTDFLKLKSELEQLKRLIFGSKSERFVPIQPLNQASLELELEKLPQEPTVKEKITYERKKTTSVNKSHPGRTPIPAHIERRTEVIEPIEDITGLKKIGEEITEVLEYQAPQFYVRRIVRPKYSRVEKQGVITAQLPSLPIEKGMAGSSLLSWIIIEKFVYHMPLHRLIQKFKTQGLHIPAPTISDWVRQSCELLDLLYEKLKDEILKQTYLQADETPIPVLDKDKEGATHQGYYWVYHAVEAKMVLFDYRQGRNKSGPTELLKDFNGFLQSDGYAAYETLDASRITLFHCMAHARRYFEQALDNDKQRAEHALTQIQSLYDIERTCREGNYTHQQREALRQEKSLPVLNDMKDWLKTNHLHVLPKSLVGKAINYSLERWEKLSLYATNGRLEIDNNLVENQVRPVAIGRKNYLFAGSHEAARRHAMIYSFIGTCKLRGIDPEKWLTDVFNRIQDHKVNKLHEFFS